MLSGSWGEQKGLKPGLELSSLDGKDVKELKEPEVLEAPCFFLFVSTGHSAFGSGEGVAIGARPMDPAARRCSPRGP